MRTLEMKYQILEFVFWVMAMIYLVVCGLILAINNGKWTFVSLFMFVMGGLCIYGYGWITERLVYFQPIKNLVVVAGKINREEAGKDGR